MALYYVPTRLGSEIMDKWTQGAKLQRQCDPILDGSDRYWRSLSFSWVTCHTYKVSSS